MMACASLPAFAQEPAPQAVDASNCTAADCQNADPWWKDVMLCTIEYGNGEMHVLEDYQPQNETPFLSFTDPYNIAQIPACIDETKDYEVKHCEDCGERMLYVDILYEINPACGHGIFSYGYYCEQDDQFIPQFFYDQCGCYTHHVREIQPYLVFVKEYLPQPQA